MRDDVDTFRSNEEPGDLLEDDWEGDAKDTGHEAPVELADGATFKEYFGMTVFGDIVVGTQIEGTVTLSLTYVDASEFGAEFPWLWVGIGAVVIVVVLAAVAVVVRRRK